MTCARCGHAMPADAWRCPACAAPATEKPRARTDCLAAVTRPTFPEGVTAEPVRLLGSVAIGALAALALLHLCQLVAAVKSSTAIGDGDSDASSVSNLRTTIAVLAFVVGAVATVSFFFWLRRVIRNAHKLGLVRQRYDNAWAVGGWFVPVLQLWRPKQVVNDAWSGSGGGSRGVLDLWWMSYLVGIYVAFPIADLVAGQASDNGGRQLGYGLEVFADVCVAAAALLGAWIVHRIVELQSEAIDPASPSTT